MTDRGKEWIHMNEEKQEDTVNQVADQREAVELFLALDYDFSPENLQEAWM